MKQNRSGLAEKLRERLPVRTLRYVPGDCFFTRLLDLPEGFDRKELEGFVELTLEGMAPFPVEQLCWGYIAPPGATRVLVFAGFRPKVQARLDEEIDDVFFLTPDFVFLCGESVSVPTVRLLENPEGLTAVALEPGSKVPVAIRTTRLQVVGDEPVNMDEEKKRLLAHPSFEKYRSRVEFYHLGEVVPGDHGLPTLRTTLDGEEKLFPLPVKGQEIWMLDLHGEEVLAARRKEDMQGARLLTGFKVLSLCLLLLLLLQIGLYGFRFADRSLQDRANRQSPTVRQIEENFSLQEKLDQFSRKELRPFDMMGVINPTEIRPMAVEYDRVRSRGLQELEIEGEGASIEMVNRFADNMRKLSAVSRVTNDVRVRQGRAAFRINVVYSDEFVTPRPVPPAEVNIPTIPAVGMELEDDDELPTDMIPTDIVSPDAEIENGDANGGGLQP